DRRYSGFRHFRFIDAPNARNIFPVFGIEHRSVTRQLVSLLSVFAAALPIALAGDRAISATAAADLAGGKNDVDIAQDVIGAVRMMFDAASVHDHARLSPAI